MGRLRSRHGAERERREKQHGEAAQEEGQASQEQASVHGWSPSFKSTAGHRVPAALACGGRDSRTVYRKNAAQFCGEFIAPAKTAGGVRLL